MEKMNRMLENIKNGAIGIADESAMSGQTATMVSGFPLAGRLLDVNDYARACIRADIRASGCMPSESMAIDPDDGRLARGVDAFDDDNAWTGEIEWSEEPVVSPEDLAVLLERINQD